MLTSVVCCSSFGAGSSLGTFTVPNIDHIISLIMGFLVKVYKISQQLFTTRKIMHIYCMFSQCFGTFVLTMFSKLQTNLFLVNFWNSVNFRQFYGTGSYLITVFQFWNFREHSAIKKDPTYPHLPLTFPYMHFESDICTVFMLYRFIIKNKLQQLKGGSSTPIWLCQYFGTSLIFG